MSNLVYSLRTKNKEYLGILTILEQRNLENMREVEKKTQLKEAAQLLVKIVMRSKRKREGLCKIRLSKIESQIKQLK
jgi:ATP-binding cassette subfamily F protein 3